MFFLLFFIFLFFKVFCDLELTHLEKPKILFEVRNPEGWRNYSSELRHFHSNTTGRSHTGLPLLSLEYSKITKCGPCYRAIMVNLLYSTCSLIPSHCILYITYCLPCVYLHSNLCLIRKILPFPQKAFNWSEGDQQVVCIKFD